MKLIKISGGRVIKMYAVRLANGNLLVQKRTGPVEAAPGTQLFKRWLPWAVEPDDPRIAEPRRRRSDGR